MTSAALAVALGAFGAHGLRKTITDISGVKVRFLPTYRPAYPVPGRCRNRGTDEKVTF